jgi:hypothetical protein
VASHGIGGLALLHRGCRLQGLALNASLAGSGAEYAASLPGEALVNGWAFSTAATQPPELDPVCILSLCVRCLRTTVRAIARARAVTLLESCLWGTLGGI